MLPKKICPKCGKETEIFVNSLCIECLKEEKKKELNLRKQIKIFQCKYCQKFSIGKNILYNHFEDALKNTFKSFKDFEIRILNFLNDEIEIVIKYENLIIATQKIKIQIKPIICKYCNMMHTGYKQAIFQLRRKDNEELTREIKELIEKEREKDNLSFISKIEKTKDGIDIYIGSRKAAYKVLKELKKYYDLKIKVSKKLVGVKSGKRVYLETFSIK